MPPPPDYRNGRDAEGRPNLDIFMRHRSQWSNAVFRIRGVNQEAAGVNLGIPLDRETLAAQIKEFNKCFHKRTPCIYRPCPSLLIFWTFVGSMVACIEMGPKYSWNALIPGVLLLLTSFLLCYAACCFQNKSALHAVAERCSAFTAPQVQFAYSFLAERGGVVNPASNATRMWATEYFVRIQSLESRGGDFSAAVKSGDGGHFSAAVHSADPLFLLET